jgi:hypothetical protein
MRFLNVRQWNNRALQPFDWLRLKKTRELGVLSELGFVAASTNQRPRYWYGGRFSFIQPIRFHGIVHLSGARGERLGKAADEGFVTLHHLYK